MGSRPLSLVVALVLFGATSQAMVARQAAAQVLSGNTVTLAYGPSAGPRAVVAFQKNRAARLPLVIETFEAGRVGSKLSILVDDDAAPILAHTFADGECRVETAKTGCMVTIRGSDMYAKLVGALRRGKVSRLQLESDGAMIMTYDISLEGFARAMPEPAQ